MINLLKNILKNKQWITYHVLVTRINYQAANSQIYRKRLYRKPFAYDIINFDCQWYLRKSHREVILSLQVVHLKIYLLSQWNFLLIIIHFLKITCKSFPLFWTLWFRPYHGSRHHVFYKFCPSLACRSHQSTPIICIRVHKKINSFINNQYQTLT